MVRPQLLQPQHRRTELYGEFCGKTQPDVGRLTVHHDSGGTLNYVRKVLNSAGSSDENIRFAVLIDNKSSQATVEFAVETIDRTTDKRWFVFPWEAVMTADRLVEEAVAVPDRLA